jgi:hypothetical protein
MIVSRGTLFGVPIEFDTCIRPGALEVLRDRDFERPAGWDIMDNGARLMWMGEHLHGARFRAGPGTAEADLTTASTELPS